VSRTSRTLDDDLALLYVGISPVRETPRQTIRSRVLGNQLNGNLGSSTLWVPRTRFGVYRSGVQRCSES
jgi:hypothetical protein